MTRKNGGRIYFLTAKSRQALLRVAAGNEPRPWVWVALPAVLLLQRRVAAGALLREVHLGYRDQNFCTRF
jgi:hypothetical protein